MGNSLICLGQIRRIAGEIRAICWEFRIASLVPVAKLYEPVPIGAGPGRGDRNRPADYSLIRAATLYETWALIWARTQTDRIRSDINSG